MNLHFHLTKYLKTLTLCDIYTLSDATAEDDFEKNPDKMCYCLKRAIYSFILYGFSACVQRCKLSAAMFLYVRKGMHFFQNKRTDRQSLISQDTNEWRKVTKMERNVSAAL